VTGRQLTSKIIKGGALIEDARRVAEAWDDSLTVPDNLRHIRDSNLLAKRSRVRAQEVVAYVIVPRFVAPGPHVVAALRRLLGNHDAFTAACYYEAAREDALLAAFAEDAVWPWSQQGKTGVQVDDAVTWLTSVDRQHQPAWSPALRARIARGLLATLRDFRVLRGAVRKEIATPDLDPVGFAYVAWREHEQGASSRGLVSSPVWHRWLLDDSSVFNHFEELARLGVLRFAAAGSAVRIDWRVRCLEEVAGAAA
jgi:hypothetical protein